MRGETWGRKPTARCFERSLGVKDRGLCVALVIALIGPVVGVAAHPPPRPRTLSTGKTPGKDLLFWFSHPAVRKAADWK